MGVPSFIIICTVYLMTLERKLRQVKFSPPPAKRFSYLEILVFFQSLVIPYILAFKGACPVHPIYAANGDLTPANNICVNNSYPAFTNVISGFEFDERVQRVIDPVSKVLGVYISSEMDN